MTLTYVAETRDHLLLLDEEGVCLSVHRRDVDLPRARPAGQREDAPPAEGAVRCVGAQYVATLDPSEPGFLGHLPKLGVPMLFAKVGPSGKISLVRTGPLERFEKQAVESPGSGVYERSPAHDLLADTQRTLSPAIRYLPDEDDEDEPTLRFPRPATSARVASPLPPPIPRLRAVRLDKPRVA